MRPREAVGTSRDEHRRTSSSGRMNVHFCFPKHGASAAKRRGCALRDVAESRLHCAIT
jgi:hypothetical protein